MENDVEVYKGNSDSFAFIAKCYIDYGMSVIRERAFSDLRDGLKPVQRRILYAAITNKKPVLAKCVTIVSDALKLHPHGDSSVYGAFCLMVDSNGAFSQPLFIGQGNLGHVYSSNPPSQFRYPKYMLHPNYMDYYKDKEIIELVRSEEGDGEEPTVFPAIYPTVLVNGTEGIAVSAGSKIPHFNFGDVIDLTVKYLREGKLDYTDIIVPDFPTGGVLVKNDEELAKIMAIGKGKLKIRANVDIAGKEIIVKEIPYGKTKEGIVAAIQKLDMKEISSAMATSKRHSLGMVTIECRSKRVVEYVLMELYRRNILQVTFSTNMIVTEGGEPFMLGVHGIIKRWCKWRKPCLIKKFKIQIRNLEDEFTTLSYFISLVQNKGWCDEYLRLMSHKGSSAAKEYLVKLFPDISSDSCTWISERRASAFHNGGRYFKRYEEVKSLTEFYKYSLENPEEYMINEMLELKEDKRGTYDRKTIVSNKDYRFSKVLDESEIVDDSYCVWTLTKDGFLKKTRDYCDGTDAICQFSGQANSILVGFDCFGRVLRVIGSEIEFTPSGDSGTFLPKYFDGAMITDKYKILYMGLLDGKKRMLVYRDGFIGYLDTSEWYGKKNIKIVNNGVCLAVRDKLSEVIEEDDIPPLLLFADNSTDKLRLACVNTNNISEKSRKSRSKVMQGNDIDVCFMRSFKDPMQIYSYIEHPEEYLGKLKIYKGNFLGDPGLLETGRYYDICRDLTEDDAIL